MTTYLDCGHQLYTRANQLSLPQDIGNMTTGELNILDDYFAASAIFEALLLARMPTTLVQPTTLLMTIE